VLARLLPHCVVVAHRTGNAGGGWLLVQSVVTRPRFVSWNTTWPMLVGASVELPCSSVVHASVKVAPFCSLTVTFSLVGVPL
jgi:hypothetical protein